MTIGICLKTMTTKKTQTHIFFFPFIYFLQKGDNLFSRINYMATPSFKETGKCTLAKHTAFSDNIRKKGTMMLG